MKKKFYALFVALLITVLAVTSAGATTGTNFKLGSLIADIVQTGLKSSNLYTYEFEVQASGIASVVCTNNGGNVAPGQNYPHTDGTADYGLKPDQISKSGRAVFSIETIPTLEANPDISWDAGGCPNSNWTAKVDFIYYDTATVTAWAVSNSDGSKTLVVSQVYSCVTTRTGPNDTPSTFDDGTVSCIQTSGTK